MRIDQAYILKKIQKYVQLKFPGDDEQAQRVKLVSYFDHGYCSGLSALYLYRKKREQESVFFGNLQLISEWDEKIESLKAGNSFLENIFEGTINDMRWVQDQSKALLMQSIKQKDLVDIFGSIKKGPSTSDLALEYSMSFAYADDNELKKSLENAVLKNNNKLIYLSSKSFKEGGHVVAIMPKKEMIEGGETYKYYYYDSNNPDGEIVFEDISKALQATLKYDLHDVLWKNEDIFQLSIQVFDEVGQVKHNYKKSSVELAESLFNENESLERVVACLSLAILNDELDIVYSILNSAKIQIAGADPKPLKECIPELEALFYEKTGQTMLCQAAVGSPNTLNYLLSGHSPVTVDVNSKNADGQTALMCAAKGHLECLILLLRNTEVNPNIVCSWWTALNYACAGDHLEIVKKLIEDPRTDVNTKDAVGDSILMFAIQNKQVDIIRTLLKREDINITTSMLQMATETKSKEIVKLISQKLSTKTLKDENLKPTVNPKISFSINEDTDANTRIYTIYTDPIDVASGIVTYSLAGSDANFFTFNPKTGEISINSSPDFEAKGHYDFEVIEKRSVDGVRIHHQFTLQINEPNPSVSPPKPMTFMNLNKKTQEESRSDLESTLASKSDSKIVADSHRPTGKKK